MSGAVKGYSPGLLGWEMEVNVAWVLAGRELTLGRRSDGGMVIVKDDAVASRNKKRRGNKDESMVDVYKWGWIGKRKELKDVVEGRTELKRQVEKGRMPRVI